MKLNRKTIIKHLLNAGIYYTLWMILYWLFVPENATSLQVGLYGLIMAIITDFTKSIIKKEFKKEK